MVPFLEKPMNVPQEKSYQKASFEWLRRRYDLDAAARHRLLEARGLGYLKQRPSLRILDLGAGAGANFYYYSQRLPSGVEWWLVERDAELLAQVPPFVGSLGNESPFSSRAPTISLLSYDFLDPDCPIYRDTFDLVLANAVFDLLSAEQFRQLLRGFRQAWETSSPLFLFTLNLGQGLRFYPGDRSDHYWCRRYEEHMRRPQAFGRAMAATCARQMRALFREQGFSVESGFSPWQISPLQTEALYAKLDFFASAMADLIDAEGRQWKSFQAWLAWKQDQVQAQQLALFVPHWDFLAKI